MSKGKTYDDDLIQCECSACENIRNSFGKIPKRQKLTCIERLVNFFTKNYF